MKIGNKITGKTFEYDVRMSRIKHMQRRIHTWADVMKPYVDEKLKYRCVMIRLSYAKDGMWKPNQIRDFMATVKRNLRDDLVGYAWAAELFESGRVHYHVILVVRRGSNIPYPDKSGWWPYGLTKIETVVRTIYYICTYTGKEYQKFGKFPDGAHMFAVWISDHAVSFGDMWKFKASALPTWLYDRLVGDGLDILHVKVHRELGGGWRVWDRYYYSPYYVADFGT